MHEFKINKMHCLIREILNKNYLKEEDLCSTKIRLNSLVGNKKLK